MISVVENYDVYEIRFRYDPTLVDMVKQVPGKMWNPSDKYWTIPRDNLGFFINQIKGTRYEPDVVIKSSEHINENATLDSTTVIPDIDVSKIPFHVEHGSKPYGHQIDFMKFAVNRENIGNMSGFLLGDDPGLGKTVEVMNLALYNRYRYGFKHCLIVCCINSSKLNWKQDIIKHTDGKEVPYILGTRLYKRSGKEHTNTGSKEKIEDLKYMKMYGGPDGPELPYFLIVNIEAFRTKSKKKYPFSDEVIRLINSGFINMIAIDEIHKNCSPSSVQGSQILEIKKQTARKSMYIPITGTPIISRPTDVFTPLKLIDGHNYDSFYMWCKRFCIYGGFNNHDVVGYKNIPALKAMLQSNMLRRLKEEVLDLPPVIHYTQYVENTPTQQALYDRIVTEMRRSREAIVKSLNPLSAFMRLRQVNGSPEIVDDRIKVDNEYIRKNAKIGALLDLISEIVERGEKVIVFSNWVEPLRTLYRFIKTKYKLCYYTGTMTESDREKNKQTFMTDPSYPVMIGTIGAMGVSHTLTAARNVIFYDEPWTYADKKQAWERIHRIGTKGSVNVYTIITRDTVDDRVHQIVYDKKDISSYIVDNVLDIRSNPALFDMLIN